MRPRSALLAALPLAAGCDLLWPESTDDTGAVSWTGQVLDGPYTGENGVFTGGTFEVTDPEGGAVDEGEEPWSDEPGTWRVQVPPSEPVAIHLAAQGMLGAAWRSTTPATDAYWFTGALFAYDEAGWLPFFEQFDGVYADVGALDGSTCWFWGATADPDAWAGAEITLTDGEGAAADLLRFDADDEGILVPADDGPVPYLLAFGLTPGDVILEATTTDGRAFGETWPARGGEVVTGWFLALPEED